MRFRVCATVVLVVLTAAPAPGQTVDELVAKYVQARGGDKWSTITSVRITGTVDINGVKASTVVVAKRPNLARQEIDLLGRKVVSAFDGSRAWMMDSTASPAAPQPLDGVQADLMKRQADFDGPLADYKTRGYAVELVGADNVGGKAAFKLRVTRSPGDIVYEYLDADSGLEVKRSVEIQADGVKETVETELSDYQAVDGVMVPHLSRTAVKGRAMIEITVQKVEFNVAVEDSAFRMPAR